MKKLQLTAIGEMEQSFMLLQALFHKQHSDEVELSGSAARQSKTKLSNIVVECRKTGEVIVLTPESLDQPSAPQKWEKCKLALVKTVGGYLLEFYSPPNAKKVCTINLMFYCFVSCVCSCIFRFIATKRCILFPDIRCT